MSLFDRVESIQKVHIIAKEALMQMQNDATSVLETEEIAVFRTTDQKWQFRLVNKPEHCCVVASSDYQTIDKFFAEPDESGCSDEGNSVFLARTAFECRFCREGIISLHAACVEKDSFSVAFTGHSGMGKSTRAKAWVDGLGAEWISGDRPAVRLEKNGSVACGVPWDGKEQIHRNVERPLLAILDVRRSSCNYLRKLSAEQALAVLMHQVFMPMWDTDTAVMAFANVQALIRKTPVYRVFCGPDVESAEAIYDILFNHPEKIREEAEEMKIKNGFVLRNIVDEFVVMPTGDNIAKFDGAVVLNEVSAFVFNMLKNAVSREDLLLAILNEYDVAKETAQKDLDALLDQFRQMGLIEE